MEFLKELGEQVLNRNMHFFINNKEHQLTVNDDLYNYSFKDENGNKYDLRCEKDTQIMSIEMTERRYGSTPKKLILSQSTFTPLNDREDKWEGTVLEGKPFGYGCIYNKTGSLLYTGFMANGLKIGYGEEFNANTGTVEYAGTFMNNQRHGFGMLFDEKATVIYEGYWAFGSNTDFSYDEEEGLHNLVEELCISDFDCNHDSFVIGDEYYVLKKLIIDDHAFSGITEFMVNGLKMLTHISIGRMSFCTGSGLYDSDDWDYDYRNQGSFSVCDCPALQSIRIGFGSFHSYTSLDLHSHLSYYSLT